MSKCIVCSSEHNEVWEGKPARCCEACFIVKQSLKGVASEIITGRLYIGDHHSAKDFDGKVICVHGNSEYWHKGIHMPILKKLPNSDLDRTGAQASIEQLKAISNLIDKYAKDGHSVLVHCAGGVERSPLTLAYHLYWTYYFHTIEEAYDYIILKRPIVSRRLDWLVQGGT